MIWDLEIHCRRTKNGGLVEIERFDDRGNPLDKEEFTWGECEDPTDDGRKDVERVRDLLWVIHEHLSPPPFGLRIYLRVRRLGWGRWKGWRTVIETEETD